MKKLLVFDVDGTIIDYDGTIPNSAIKAIRQARKNGNLAIIVTGRARSHIEDYILDIGFDGIIGGNGSYIELNNQVIKEQTISKEDIIRIVDYLNQHNLEYYLEGNIGLYGSKNFKIAGVEALRRYGIKDPDLNKLYPAMTYPDNLYVEHINKVNYILNDYQDYLDFKEAFPEFKVMTWGGKGESAIFGDCALNNIDKQVAIKEVINTLNISKENVISFGDAEVDIPMFEISGISVCLGSGRKEAKEHASFVTKAVKDDGIAYALKQLNVI